MKALVPCCERARTDAKFVRPDIGAPWIWLQVAHNRHAQVDARIPHDCPWCGKRFEVVEQG